MEKRCNLDNGRWSLVCAFISSFRSFLLSFSPPHSRVCTVLYDAFEVWACVCINKQFWIQPSKRTTRHSDRRHWKRHEVCFFLCSLKMNDELSKWLARMFLLIILLSYLLGCASTVALLLYLYTRYAFYSPVTVNEQPEEPQYEPFHALPEVSVRTLHPSNLSVLLVEWTSEKLCRRHGQLYLSIPLSRAQGQLSIAPLFNA